MEFLVALGLALGLNLLVFLLAYKKQTDKFTDLTYAVTFLAIAVYFYLTCHGTVTMTIALILIALWAARLGLYLGVRIHKMGRDKRFDKIRPSFRKFGTFWTLQGLSVWVIMLPTMLLMSGMPGALKLWAVSGIVIFALGLIIEAIADQQKYNFLADSKNKGKWIESGLWGYSRHPNYLGEIMVWLGIYLFALPYLELWQALVGLIGPLWITILLVFVTGIPKAEAGADARWGKDKAYKNYKKRVPALIPRKFV